MAIKHVEEYYKQVCNTYTEMRDNLKEMEDALQNEMIEPERVETLREMVRPLMENWERWSYMMYLLHKPRRESKERVYQKRNKEFLARLKHSNSPEAMLKIADGVNKNLKEETSRK